MSSCPTIDHVDQTLPTSRVHARWSNKHWLVGRHKVLEEGVGEVFVWGRRGGRGMEGEFRQAREQICTYKSCCDSQI